MPRTFKEYRKYNRHIGMKYEELERESWENRLEIDRLLERVGDYESALTGVREQRDYAERERDETRALLLRWIEAVSCSCKPGKTCRRCLAGDALGIDLAEGGDDG